MCISLSGTNLILALTTNPRPSAKAPQPGTQAKASLAKDETQP
ncbi:hypothetical protein ABZX39_32240 [Streptomyces collinus]